MNSAFDKSGREQHCEVTDPVAGVIGGRERVGSRFRSIWLAQQVFWWAIGLLLIQSLRPSIRPGCGSIYSHCRCAVVVGKRNDFFFFSSFFEMLPHVALCLKDRNDMYSVSRPCPLIPLTPPPPLKPQDQPLSTKSPNPTPYSIVTFAGE